MSSENEPLISSADLPAYYDPDKKVPEYTVSELADLLSYLVFRIQDLHTRELSDPFSIKVKLNGAQACQDLTVQSLMDIMKDLEWSVSDQQGNADGILQIFLGKKIGN